MHRQGLNLGFAQALITRAAFLWLKNEKNQCENHCFTTEVEKNDFSISGLFIIQHARSKIFNQTPHPPREGVFKTSVLDIVTIQSVTPVLTTRL